MAAEGCPCLAEPRINASEDVVLHVAGVAVTLQCNLTSSPSPLAASYWVKNGEEIPGTRKLSNTTEYRWVAWESLVFYSEGVTRVKLCQFRFNSRAFL